MKRRAVSMNGFSGAVVFAVAILAGGRAFARQTPPGRASSADAPAAAKKNQAAAPTPSPGMEYLPPRTAHPEQVVATVDGRKITRGEVFAVVRNYLQSITKDREQYAYGLALDSVIRHHLLVEYVEKHNIKVTDKEVDEDIARLERELKESGHTLASFMADNDVSLAELKEKGRTVVLFQKFQDKVATDAALKKFIADHPDIYNRVKLRASHIFLRIEPEMSAPAKKKIRDSLVALRKQIESGKIAFKDAANKYSQDQVNIDRQVGGDIGWFSRFQFQQDFEEAVFKLKQGTLSDVIETPFGYHLVIVTDRKEGEPVKFEEVKEQALEHFKQDLEEKIVTEQAVKLKDKITREPMPPDFFPVLSPPLGHSGNPKTDPASIQTKATTPAAQPPRAPSPKASNPPK